MLPELLGLAIVIVVAIVFLRKLQEFLDNAISALLAGLGIVLTIGMIGGLFSLLL